MSLLNTLLCQWRVINRLQRRESLFINGSSMLQKADEHLCLRQPGFVSQVCPFAVPSDKDLPTADRLVYWTLSGTALSHFVQRYSCHVPCLSKANTAVPLLGKALR